MSATCKHGALLTEGCDDCGPIPVIPKQDKAALLSCPWCKVPPEVCKSAGYGFTVECVNEVCQVGPALNVTRGRANAIKAWNTRATITPAFTSDSARRAAEEIAANYEVHKDRCHSNERYPSPPCDCGAIEEVTAIIERHAAAPADNDAESLEVRFCWVCRSNHRLIASECRAMDGIA